MIAYRINRVERAFDDGFTYPGRCRDRARTVPKINKTVAIRPTLGIPQFHQPITQSSSLPPVNSKLPAEFRRTAWLMMFNASF